VKNYRLTVDLQMDSNETVSKFAEVLSKTMQITAEMTIDLCTDESAHITLGLTKIESAESFEENRP
jgi:predicted metalloenzyme YecM